MAYCANCGGPLSEGQQFCPNCGQRADQSGAPAPPAGPPPAAAPPPPAGTAHGAPGGYSQGRQYPQGPQYPAGQQYPPTYQQAGWTPPRKPKRTGLWIGLAALVVAIVVACVLVFVVFHDDIFGGGGSTPEATVTKFLNAMEDKDIDTMFDLLDQEAFGALFPKEYLDMAKDAMADEMVGEGSIKFNNIRMETTQTSNTTATVIITAGSVTVIDRDGDKEVNDVRDEDGPVEFYLVKRDGSWYIDPVSLNF